MAESPPTVEQLVNDLAQLPGVITVALANTQAGLIERTRSSFPANPPLSTEQRVLSEAMISAAQELAQRAGLGDAKEIHQTCTQGGLLMVRIDTHRWWILHHRSDSMPAMLRVALREAAENAASFAANPFISPTNLWNSGPIPSLGKLPLILFREQKEPIQIESTVYNSPNPA